MPLDPKTKQIYTTLKSGGADVGTEDEFKNYFYAQGKSGYENRKKVYDTLKGGGADAGKNYEEFRDWLGLKAVTPQRKQQASAMIGGKATQPGYGDGSILKRQPKNAVEMLEQNKPEQFEASYDVPVGNGKTVKRKVNDDIKMIANRQLEPMKQQFVDKNGNVVKEQEVYPLENPELSYERALNQSVAASDLERQSRERLAEIEREENALKKKQSLGDSFFMQALANGITNTNSSTATPGVMNQRAQAYNEYLKNRNPELEALAARKDLAKERIKLIEDAKKDMGIFADGEGLSGVVRNATLGPIRAFQKTKEKVLDPKTWDFGATDANTQMAILDAVTKLGSGEQLSKNEQKLLDDWALTAAVNSHYGDQLSGWTKAAMVTGDAFPYMLEMGFSPFSRLGGAAQRELMRFAEKKYGKKVVEGFMKRQVANKITKGAGLLGRVGGDALGANLMATTSGSARVAGDTARRMSGDVKSDIKDGNVVFAGTENGETAGDAIFKSIKSQAIEDWSEMAGQYFGFVNNAVGKLIGKSVVGKAGRKALGTTGNIDNVSLGKAQRFIYDLTARKGVGAFSEGLDQFLKKTKWDGVFGEYAEEVLGNMANAITVGDQTLDTKEGTGVFNLEQNIDTFCGVALLGGFMSAVKTGGYAWHKFKNNPDKVSNENSKIIDNWQAVKTSIDNAADDPREINDLLTDLIRTPDQYDDKQKKAILKYTASVMEERGQEMAAYKPRVESMTTEQSTTESADGNSTVPTFVVSTFDKNGNEIEKQTFYSEDDADAYKTQTKMEQQKQDYDEYLNMAGKLNQQETETVIDTFLKEHGYDEADDSEKSIMLQDINDSKTPLGKEFRDYKNEKSVEKAQSSMDAIRQFEEDNGWEEGTVRYLSERDPMKMSEEELQIADKAREFLKALSYPSSVVHPEISAREGSETADQVVENVVSTTEPINPEDNPGKDIVDSYVSAEKERNALFNNDENLKEEVEMMEAGGLSPQEIISSLDTFSDAQKQVLINYYNAQAKYDSYMLQAENKINEVAAQGRQKRTFAGTINGQEDKANIIGITDGTNTYTLISGDISTSPEGNVTGSESGMLLALDENGEIVQLGESSNYTVLPTEMTLDEWEAQEVTRLQQEVSMVSDPNMSLAQTEQTQEKPQEEQADVEAGGENTGADEASATPTATERIPVDEEGNPVYEKAAPEDVYDSLTEQVGDMTPTIVKNQLDAAKKRLEKLVKDKEAGKLKGKTIQEQVAEVKELQEKINAEQELVNFWTKVMTVPNNRRADEANKPAPEPTETTETVTNETPVEEKVPDWTVDKASDARARGYRMENGYRVDRQEPISNKVEGNDIEVKFDKNEEPVKGKLVVVESGSLIPSHVNGQRNVNFFINEAQPKERTDIDSDASSTRIAKKINPEEITAGVTAFTGSPVVNTRGEVIQGNNRTIGLQKMWNNYPDSQDKYKQYLIDHAEEFGLNKDEIVKMSSPVLVRMVDVPDEEAIRLGQKTASNTESGGKERIDPMRVIQQMGEQYRVFTNLLFSGEIEDQTLMSIISENGVKVLKWLNDSTSHPKYISDTQFQSCFDAKDNLTEEAKTDLRKIVENMLFQDAPESLSEMFYKMPAKAQNAILSTLWRDSQSEENDKIIKDIQSSIEAFAVINSASEEFRNAKDVNSARAAVKDLKKQTQMFGNTETVLEKFSNFALELAILYKGAKQNDIRGYFNTYYDGVQGKGGSLFETPEKKSKEQAIKDTYGIDINEKENGEEGNNTLESDNTNGESGEPNNEGEPGVGERVEEGEQPAVSGGGTETNEEVEAATEEQPTEEAVEEQPKEEEPFELTLEALEASDLDESVKSGARAWLNGEKTQANQFAFLIAQDYVRSIHGDTERGGTDADASQLGSEDNVSANGEAGRGNGESGQVDSADNGEGVPEVGIGGTDSTGNVAGSNGAGSDNGVSGQAPEQNGDSDTNGTLGSIGNRRTRRNGKSRGEGSGTTISGGNAGRQTVASARAELDAALKEFEDALKESITEPLKGKLLAADPVSLYAFLGGAKAIKVLSAGTKVAYAAIKLGYYEFKDWVGMMKSKLGDPLRNIAGMSEEQIDGFIEMMWDYDLTVDGVTRKVSEWASVISDEALREQMGKTIEEKRKLQKEAEKTPTILGDITNIRESLPFLLTKQQEDVQKAERQFFDESHADVRHGHGKGYMFTNGTGTGKTYTGLGIVKRFLKQGKGRILIVTASETKINDWIKDAKNLGIEASMLPDTSSKGKGVVVTQFANIRQNRKLLEDVFDLIVYDESHKLMENQDGSATSTSRAHHMLSNRDVRQALRRELMAGEFGKAIEDAEVEIDLLNQAVSTPTTEWTKEIKDAYNKAGGNMDAVEDRIKELKELTERLEETIENEVDKLLADPEQVEKAREATKNTKVVFLSATPFNVPANMDYAEGYIFSYSNDDEVKKETDRLRDRDSFLVENFNSSHTRNPKTQVVSRISQERIPDPQKASEEEVIFSDKLQNDLETMSGRDLDSEYDYSREFPKMDFEMADKFNDAIQSLSDGRFDPLRKYFDHLLDDYTTMTGYLEIFKAQMIAPRIQQYIDLGKKVTLYHRRKASNSNMYPPFALAMQKARQEGDEKIDDAVEAFERAFESLFQWEDSIDYMFPQDSILREFMTDKEKETYKKETEEWTEQYGKKIVKLQGEVMDLNIQISLLENSGHKEKTPELLDQIKEKNKEIDKLMKKRPKPKCAVVSVFNGSETAKDRSEAIRKFNDDDSKTKVLVVQVQAGKEGISLHDTTGKYPRVQIGIFLPQSPIEFIQTEGRIFRVGNKSNAIFEYPLLGLDIELGNFAQKINGRSETTENLALGSRGRGLKDSISRAALASRKIDPSTATGIGGKELDSRQAQNADGFDEAMKNYSEWREEPKPTDINQIEIPDPIGYVMTKLARAENGERALVPNARRGSVARYMPMTTRLTAMEERNKDYARLSALIGGSGRKILNEPFADHSRVNKYDIVVLNTAHGENGEKDIYGQFLPLDTRDVLKACNHTDPSGRVVALVESEKVSEIKNVLKKSTTSVPVMEVKLPSFVLGKPSSILVIDNIEDRKKREAIISQELDLSQAKTEDNLFAQLRDMVVPERNIDVEGRIERKLRTTVTPFVNTGCIAKAKNYNTGKMEPDIRIQFGNMYVHFARGKMAWRTGYGRVFNSFVLRYGRIAQNETGYIQEAARNWVAIQRDLELDDDELLNTYRYYISNNKDRLGGVRDNLRIMAQAIEIALGKTPMQIKNIAEGKVENEVSGTYDLKGFRDVFNSLNNNDAELEALADKVFEAVDHIEGLKFSVLPGAAFRSGGGHNVVAHYVPSRNVIELNSDLFNAVRIKDSFKAQTVVHEMIHALTTWAIETYDNENTRGQLSPEQQEAVRTIKDVYSQINNDDFRRQLRLESELEDNAEYGLTNEHEMMAELSNPIFRKVLKAKKLWRQLINGVKMLLGIEIPNAESEETDALTALDNALETLMNTYDPTLYSSYIRNNEVVRNMEIRNPNDPIQAINDAAEGWRRERRPGEDTEDANERFNNELDDFKNKRHKGLLHLGKPGEILKTCGINAKELTLSPSVLHSKLKEHNLTTDDLKGLAKAIQNPILVYKHGLNYPNIVVVTNLDVNGGKLSVSITLDKDGNVVEISNISSVHSKEVLAELERLSDLSDKELKDSLKWVEKEEVSNWINSVSLYGGRSGISPRLISTANIIISFDNPTISTKINTSNPSEAIENAAESRRHASRNPVQGNKGQEIKEFVNSLPDRFGLKGGAPSFVINSPKDLEDVKGKVNKRVYAEIERLYNDADGGAAYIPRGGIVVMFGERIEDEKEAENVWWHEQAHCLWQRLPENVRRKYGEDCFGWLEKNRPDIYSHIKRSYEMQDWLNEACSFLIGDVVIEKVGTERFLHDKFVGNEDICNFANELRNYIKNGKREINNQLRRTGEGEQESETEVQGRSEAQQNRRSLSIRHEDKQVADPIRAIEKSAKLWRKHKADEEGTNPMYQSERAVYEERLDRVETVFSEAYQDSMISLKAGQNAIAHDKDIPDSQNAYMAENLMHGKNKVEMDMFNAMFRDPLIETINRIMEATGMNWGDIDRYVYTKSGLERNREFFVRDWLEKNKDEDGVDDIRQQWEDLKQKADNIDDSYTLKDYLNDLTKFIKDNIDSDYEPSEHDYSGFRAMFGEDYDEEEVINELMETENEICADNVSELWDKVNACTKYGLERYRQSGLKSDEQIDNVKNMFHWYVPMRGFKEETNEDLYQYFTGKGKTKNYVGGLLKHAKGRGSEASYPISTIFSMTYKAISDCNQNLVNQKFYRLCQAHKNDLVVLSDAWIKLNEATGEWEEVWPDINDDMTEEEIRQATLDFEKNMNTLANVKKAQKIRGKANFPYKMLDKNKKNEHVVEVWMNGQKKLATVVGNPRMAQALNGQLRFEKGNNIFSKVNMWIKNQMASLFTSYSPTFALRNMMRDWTHFRTMLTVREGEKYAHAAAKYYAEQMPKMMTLFKKYREGTLGDSEMEQDFKDYMYQGGITGFVQMRKVDDIQNEMEKLNKQMKDGKVIKLNNKLWDYTLGAVEAFNEAIENNARFATYRASRHVAMRTKARSAYDAKEITVNFNRKGAGAKTFGFKGSDRVEHAAQAAGVTAQILGEGRIFFNATIQAICTIFKNTQNPDGSLNIPYIKRLVTRYALPPFMFGFALPLINEALAGIYGDGDDDPYANLPEWTRRKNLCIYVGHNNFITIPVGQELAAFLSLGDMFAGMTYAPNLKPLDRTFAEDLADAFNTFSPIDIDTKITKGGITRDPLSEIAGRTFSVLAPVVAVEQNLSWTGRPIYREDVYKNDKYTPEYQMVYSGTNPVLVEASRILHELGGGDDVTRGEMEVNPAIVQYLWEQYTGGPGKVFSNLISVGHDVKDVIEGRESDFNMRKIEGLKAFVQQGDDRTEFYRANAKYRKYREDAEKLYNDIKGYKQLSEKDPMAKIKMASKTRGVDYTRMQIVRKAEKYLSKMNKEANAAEGARKRELRRAVNEEIKSIVDVLDKVEEDK